MFRSHKEEIEKNKKILIKYAARVIESKNKISIIFLLIKLFLRRVQKMKSMKERINSRKWSLYIIKRHRIYLKKEILPLNIIKEDKIPCLDQFADKCDNFT